MKTTLKNEKMNKIVDIECCQECRATRTHILEEIINWKTACQYILKLNTYTLWFSNSAPKYTTEMLTYIRQKARIIIAALFTLASNWK